MAVRRRYGNRQRQRGERRRAILIFVLAGSILLAVLAGAVYFKPETLDADGCPVAAHRAPPAKTVILIDETDSLSRQDLSFVRRLVKNEYAWLPKGGALSIRMIDADVPEGLSKLNSCRMSDGSDAYGIVDNPVALRREYDNKVGKRLETFLRDLATQPTQPASPIVEAISGTMADPAFGADVPARRLVIVSDMAQNSEAFTQYGRRRPRALPDEVDSDYPARFDEVAVRVQYLRRPRLSLQGAAHRTFWRNYFARRGSADVAIGRDLGLGEAADRAIWYDKDGEAKGAK